MVTAHEAHECHHRDQRRSRSVWQAIRASTKIFTVLDLVARSLVAAACKRIADRENERVLRGVHDSSHHGAHVVLLWRLAAAMTTRVPQTGR
jgi:hypothetical protein